jgi:ribosomal protein S18 acetylase RimI-like enzyme
MTPTVTIRPAASSEWNQLRDLWLRALTDSPKSFAIRIERAQAEPPAYWLRLMGGGQRSSCFIAVDDHGDWQGMILVRLEPDSKHARLSGLWVAPAARGRGIARMLINHSVSWARQHHAQQLLLWVSDRSTAAVGLYSGFGFQPTGRRQALPSNAEIEESEMCLVLSPGPLG